MIKGIDVSVYQDSPATHSDDIDWAKVKAAGYEFVYARADAGASYNDPQSSEFYDKAKAAGFLAGFYHYARPSRGVDVVLDATREADHFLRRIGDRIAPDDLPPVLDLEESEIDGCALEAWAWRFGDRIRAVTGRKPGLYTNPSYLKSLKSRNTLRDVFRSDWWLWIAHWGVTSPGTLEPWPLGEWRLWQTSASKPGGVPGIQYACDLDVFNGSREELEAWIAET